jgi:heme oxygenase (biliverdin-IX-beta and delta-forming)
MQKLLEKLRNATHDLHLALHSHPLLRPLQSDDITLDDYYWCLRAFYSVYLLTEKESVSSWNKLPSVPLLLWLESDLHLHGIMPMSINVRSPTPIDTLSKYIGYCYVRNGSMLGGQVISKHLFKHLGLQPHISNYFFAGLGAEVGRYWKEFVLDLDNEHIIHDECVQHALYSFALIHDACDATLHVKHSANKM